MPLEEAAGLTLARDVFALYDIPGFLQSSMDGYAFAFDEYMPGKPMPVAGLIAAGSADKINMARGSACRIFTGAPLPTGADTVIMQESVSVTDGMLTVTGEQPIKGQLVRPVGSEIRKNELILGNGHVLSAPSVSYLAGTGVTEVIAYPSPVVTIIVTGNEFQPRGTTPEYGRVFESNSIGLKAALKSVGISEVHVQFASDSLTATVEALSAALLTSQLVLLTGGVSVGDYDFVVGAAASCGISRGFHKVKQKPGKPLYFGTKRDIPVFGLPGNPSSVLTCYYEYVLEAIQILSCRPCTLQKTEGVLLEPLKKSAGLTHFMKATLSDGSVNFLNAQESFRLASFARANCLLIFDEYSTSLQSGDKVEVHILPSSMNTSDVSFNAATRNG